MTDNTQELEELYDNWFYSLADKEPDDTYTLTVHEVHDGGAYSKLEELITDWHNKQVLQARLDTATDILYGFSRTYKQEVTDTAGNVYVNDSHGYISKYEVQELVEKLKQEQRAIEAERNKLKESSDD